MTSSARTAETGAAPAAPVAPSGRAPDPEPGARLTAGDRLFTGLLVVYGVYALLALLAGIAAAAAIPLGWHDRLHELAFTAHPLLASRFEALADAAHGTQPVYGLVLDYLFSVLNLALAGFLLWLRPRERTARLLAVALVGTAAVFNLQSYAVYEVLEPSLLDQAANIVFHVAAAVAYAAALLTFPDGRLVPRWPRGALVALYGLLGAAAGYGAFAIRGTSRTLALILLFGLLTPAIGVAAQAYRYRTATNERERQQARTLFLALVPALVLGAYVLQQGLAESAFEVYGGRDLEIIPTALFRVFQPLFALIPLALFAGIVRFRLWGIDRVITRTLTYGALAGFVTVVYVGVVVGLGRLIGAQSDNLVLSVVATGLVALGFEPARERFKRVADRLVYGRRATPLEVLADFSERLGESVETEEKLARLARLLAEGTAATRADIWLRVGEEFRPAASWPGDEKDLRPVTPAGEDELPDVPGIVVPVRHEGELLGALALRLPAGESLTPVDERLLSGLSGQVSLVLRNVRLTAELLDRLEELRESRRRLLAAQDEARRRLERDLHDGAQQQLVSIRVKLNLCERMVERGADVSAMLHDVGEETEDAVATLRDLAHGIYPPLLAERGLAMALRSRADKSHLNVTVNAPEDLGRYDEDTEAAIYFSCLEGLQNVAKYAEAEEVEIRLWEEGRELHFEVRDDGKGFDPSAVPPGAGLQNIGDRIDALEGVVTVRSAPGSGTTLAGWVPARRMEEKSAQPGVVALERADPPRRDSRQPTGGR